MILTPPIFSYAPHRPVAPDRSLSGGLEPLCASCRTREFLLMALLPLAARPGVTRLMRGHQVRRRPCAGMIRIISREAASFPPLHVHR